MVRVLLLEDDTFLAELIKEHLTERGFVVTHFSDGEAAESALLKKCFDLLLLDVGVPGIDGFELLETLRTRRDRTPSIFITSRNSSADLKKGFEIGCDDYIKKPFEFEELDARINHLIRMYGMQREEPLTLEGDIVFEPWRHRLFVSGREVVLTPKASEILHYLLRHAGRIVSREELLQSLWSWEEAPTDATLRSYIRMLRKEVPGIVTERGVGYGYIPKRSP